MIWTRIAAALMALTFLVHVFVGGQDVHAPMQAALPDPGLAAFAAILWHMASAVLAVLAYGIWELALRNDPQFEAVLSAIQLGFAAVFMFYGLTRLGTLWLMPQWTVFLIVPILTRFGQSRKRIAPSSREAV